MKVTQCILFLIFLSCVTLVKGQASSSRSFRMSFKLPEGSLVENFNVYYGTLNGHYFKEVEAFINASRDRIDLIGVSDFVVGVPFPPILIEEEVYENDDFYERRFYSIQFYSHGRTDHIFSEIPLLSSFKTVRYDMDDSTVRFVQVNTASCTPNYCEEAIRSLVPNIEEWNNISILEQIENEPLLVEPVTRTPSFFISGKSENYSKAMKLFSQKYHVNFIYQRVSGSDEERIRERVHNYNLMDQLNRIYGTGWKADVPVRIYGM